MLESAGGGPARAWIRRVSNAYHPYFSYKAQNQSFDPWTALRQGPRSVHNSKPCILAPVQVLGQEHLLPISMEPLQSKTLDRHSQFDAETKAGCLRPPYPCHVKDSSQRCYFLQSREIPCGKLPKEYQKFSSLHYPFSIPATHLHRSEPVDLRLRSSMCCSSLGIIRPQFLFRRAHERSM